MAHYPTTITLLDRQIKAIFNGHTTVALHLSCPCCGKRVTLEFSKAPHGSHLDVFAKDTDPLNLEHLPDAHPGGDDLV